MPGDAEATKRRLLDAALREFSAHGVAGARVDRIARQARSNKAQIYHYFGSKVGLFHALMEEIIERTLRENPIDPLDLPGYAGRLFDGYEAFPEVGRMVTWYRLEGGQPVAREREASRAKVDAIAQAQAAGALPRRLPAGDLLVAVRQLAAMWSGGGAEAAPDDGASQTPAERRAAVVAAVTRLVSEEAGGTR